MRRYSLGLWLLVFPLSSLTYAATGYANLLYPSPSNLGTLTFQYHNGSSWVTLQNATWSSSSGGRYIITSSWIADVTLTVRLQLPGPSYAPDTAGIAVLYKTTDYNTYDFSAPPPTPDPFLLKADFSNESDYPRIVQVDIGCDGSIDDRFVLYPGQTGTRTWVNETAGTPLCVTSGRIGPDGEMLPDADLAEFAPEDWTQTPTNSPPAAFPVDLEPGTGVRTDTASADPAKQSIAWSAASQTNDLAALRQGFSSLRSATVEGDKDATDLLRLIATNTTPLRHTPDNDALRTSQSEASSDAQSDMGSAFGALTNAVLDIDTTPPTGSADSSAWQATIKGVIFDFRGAYASSRIAGLRDFAYYGFRAVIWLSFASMVVSISRSQLNTLTLAPQGSAASAIPIASSGTALTMAIAISVLIIGAATAMAAVSLSALSHASFASGFWPSGWAWAGDVIALASYWVPLTDLIAASLGLLTYEITASTITYVAAIGVRYLVG